MKRCIIVGAGDVDITALENTLDSEQYVLIAADGGYDILKTLHRNPNFLIGDWDSVLEELPKEEQERITLPTRKDDTDMLAAIRLGLEQGLMEFHLHGIFGGARFDHSLANLQCMRFICQQGGTVYGYYKNSVITMASDEQLTFDEQMQGYLSVFAMDSSVESVTLKNLEYELEDAKLENHFPIGVSNQFNGNAAEICVKNGMAAIVYPFHNGREIENRITV